MSRKLTHVLAAALATSGLFAGLALAAAGDRHDTRLAVVCCGKH